MEEVEAAVGEDGFGADLTEAIANVYGLFAGEDFVIGCLYSVIEGFGECVGKEGDHDFVMACEAVACAALHGWALDDVDAGAVVLDHVEVGGDKVVDHVA